MYNGIGLQTARGSGTNGYVQTNKFFVRPRNGGKPVSGGKGFDDDQGTAGLSKKPNKDILEHDRKRQIHLKLVILEDKLADQGYSDAEIAQKLEEARVNLEAASASEENDGRGDSKISDTQTHQIAARKEKQMEAFRSALGLPDQQQAEEGIIDGEPTEEAYEGGGVGRLKERREHSFLDRGSGRKLDEDVEEKDGKAKEAKKQRGDDDLDEVKRPKKKDNKKRRHGDSSDESEDHSRDRRRRSKKKAKGRKRRQDTDSESDSSSSDSESESDSGEKRRKKATKKRSRSKKSFSSESEEVESDDSTKFGRSRKKKRPSNRSGSKEVKGKQDEERRAGRKRHDSDVSDSESEDNKQQLHKKKEAYPGGQKQRRDEDRDKGDSRGKKAARDSDDSEPEYEKKKQLRSVVEAYSGGMKQRRDEEETLSKHGRDKYRSDSRGKKVASDSDDSETENENRRQLKDESYQRGRMQKREKDEDYNNHGRDRYRGGDDGGYSKPKMDDRYRGRAIEEEDNNDKRDDDDEYKHDRDRYRQRRETAKEGDEDFKHGRDRYIGEREERFRGDASAGKRRASYKEDEDGERISREREFPNKGRAHHDGRTSEKRSSYADRD